jgi:predicted amidohydrolase YtcJ
MYKLFFNGKIHALDQSGTTYGALLVLEDRIVFCGNMSEINLAESRLKKIDLHGQHVYPGFIDCHTHIAAVALKKERVNLDHCQTLDETLHTIGDYAANCQADTWILGGGWNANDWPDGKPAKEHLDRVCPENPVALYNKDGHTLWLNSRALKLCAFHQYVNLSTGEQLGRDEDGQLSGLVYENACAVVEQVSGKTTYHDLKRCMKKLAPELYALGITSVHSCESLETWVQFQEMDFNHELPLRVCMHPPVEKMEQFIQAGLRSAFGNEWLRLGGLKCFVDGSLGSQTAEMFENFQNLSHAGIEVMTEDRLFDNVRKASYYGLSSVIHAIGDKAVFKTLNVLDKCRKISKKKRLRHRIEHAQIMREEEIKRFGDLDIIASMQPMHISDDIRIADYYLGHRTCYTYPIRSLLDSGCRIVFGSDMPVADPDPLKGISAAIGRRYHLDLAETSWQAQQCITASQALSAYTRDAAYASYEETVKGTLLSGYLADLIILNTDLEQADEKILQETHVKMTVLGGEIVFQEEDV